MYRDLCLFQIRHSINKNNISIKEVTQKCLNKIEETKKYNAYITVAKNGALEIVNQMTVDESKFASIQ